MIRALGALVRGFAVILVFACGLAVCVARLEPKASPIRIRQEVRHAAVNGMFFLPARDHTEVVDTETGCLEPLKLPAGESLQWATFSDWTDERGESVVVGRWTSSTGSAGTKSCAGLGIGRFSFPSGRPINRVRSEHAPASTPCWYPGEPARILFTAADGLLYHYTFPAAADGNAAMSDGDPQPIAWPNPPAGLCGISIQDPHWPTDARLEGRLFATVSFRRRGPERVESLPSQIWWLRLDAAGTSIVDAGRLASDQFENDTLLAPDFDERLPGLARVAGGDLTLAYYVHRRNAKPGELRMAPIEFDPQSNAPTFRHHRSRKLAVGCVAIPPLFTPAGDGVFVLTAKSDSPTTVRRVACVEPLLPVATGSLTHRPGARRSLTYRDRSTPAGDNPG